MEPPPPPTSENADAGTLYWLKHGHPLYNALGSPENPANVDRYRRVLQTLFRVNRESRRTRRMQDVPGPNGGPAIRYYEGRGWQLASPYGNKGKGSWHHAYPAYASIAEAYEVLQARGILFPTQLSWEWEVPHPTYFYQTIRSPQPFRLVDLLVLSLYEPTVLRTVEELVQSLVVRTHPGSVSTMLWGSRDEYTFQRKEVPSNEPEERDLRLMGFRFFGFQADTSTAKVDVCYPRCLWEQGYCNFTRIS